MLDGIFGREGGNALSRPAAFWFRYIGGWLRDSALRLFVSVDTPLKVAPKKTIEARTKQPTISIVDFFIQNITSVRL